QPLEQRHHRVQSLKHEKGESAAGRTRTASAHASRRAALRASQLGGAPPDADSGAIYPHVLRRSGPPSTRGPRGAQARAARLTRARLTRARLTRARLTRARLTR